jgi:hypothetical protein
MPLVDDPHLLPLQSQFEQSDYTVLGELRGDCSAP